MIGEIGREKWKDGSRGRLHLHTSDSSLSDVNSCITEASEMRIEVPRSPENIEKII
jgi:hypothetical protein